MAVKQSSLLSNRASLTSAGTPNAPSVDRGKLRVKAGTISLATGDLTANDIIMLAGLPITAVVHQIWIANDDLDSGSTPALAMHVGLWENEDDTSETKDEDVYATAVTQFQSATGFTDLAFEARGIEKAGQAVWQDAGDTARTAATNHEYFVGLEVSTAAQTAASGDLSFMIVYSDE